MGRTNVYPIQQPDDLTCGPTALKHALESLGIHRSLDSLIDLCKTTRNGTSTRNMVKALNKIGLPVLVVEYATLHHLQSALRSPAKQVRAVLVSYLYDLDEKSKPRPESGHWAMVSSYLASKSRIVLLDSSTGRRKSYDWMNFRSRWMDYDLKRKKVKRDGKRFKLVRRWQSQLMMVVAREEVALPKFRIDTSRMFVPGRTN